jgi:Flp pilus assembly pilin Flp
MTRVKHKVRTPSDISCLLEDTRGVTAIEYTLIAALIVMAFVFLIGQIGDFVSVPFETLASYL